MSAELVDDKINPYIENTFAGHKLTSSNTKEDLKITGIAPQWA